jgi:hypothetical protein
MDDPYAVDRRRFLRTRATAAAATAVACGVPEGRWRSLTKEEATTLGAACDQIIPPDECAGAAEAGSPSRWPSCRCPRCGKVAMR